MTIASFVVICVQVLLLPEKYKGSMCVRKKKRPKSIEGQMSHFAPPSIVPQSGTIIVASKGKGKLEGRVGRIKKKSPLNFVKNREKSAK